MSSSTLSHYLHVKGYVIITALALLTVKISKNLAQNRCVTSYSFYVYEI